MENTHAEKLKVCTCMEYDKEYDRLDNIKNIPNPKETSRDLHNFRVYYNRDITRDSIA